MTSLFETVARDIDVTLGVDQALMRFCRHLSHVVPIEGAFIGKHLADSRQVLFVARADLTTSQPMHINVPVSDAVQHYLTSKNRPESCSYPLRDFPSMQHLNKSVIPTNRSYMEIRLRAGDTPIGMIGMYSTAKKSFDDAAARLMLDVRQPLAQTLAVYLLKKGLFSLPGALPDSLTLGVHCLGEESDGMAPTVSLTMHRVLQQIDAVAPLPHTVLLLGETGVGKEVLARRLHACSPRSSGPFIHVNCGGLPELLADSELFGHERGAFTGAEYRHAGFFEQADGGTIFLDEIGELPLSVQSRLLLTLQDKTINRLGGRQRIPLDFRVIAATNRNLNEMALSQTFRRDLLYRLNALTINVPSLRDRREDIPALVDYFVRRTTHHLGMAAAPGLPDEVLAQWMAYDWPGNVRELANRIEQMLIFGDSGMHSMSFHLPSHTPFEVGVALGSGSLPEDASLQRYTRIHIQQVLDQTQGRVAGPGGAAEILEVHPSTLRSRMKKLGIVYGRRYPQHYRRLG